MPLNAPRADSGGPATVRPGPAAGLALAGCVGVALSAEVASGTPILARRWTILVLLAIWSGAWVAGVLCAFRLPRRTSLLAVSGVALALRLAALAGPPTLSDDMYRYSWDGRVQTAGIDPYGSAPEAPSLARLREPWLWPPDAACAHLDRPPGCTRINRPSERTIYPPVAEGWFAAVYRLAGIGSRHKAWQGAGLATEMALLGLLPVALRRWGRDERWLALYALSPFPVLEVVNNGHVDGLAALVAVGALIVVARRRPAWAGALLGAAALVKLYPAVLIPGLAGGSARRRSALARAGAAVGVVASIGYLPHVASQGWHVLGFLPGYLREEHYDGGGRFLLAAAPGLPAVATTVVAAGLIALLVVGVVVGRRPAPEAFTVLLGGLLLVVTPVQPWYAVTLLAVATVAARPVWALVAAAGYPYFFAIILDAAHPVAIGRATYGAAFAAVVAVQVANLRARPLS